MKDSIIYVLKRMLVFLTFVTVICFAAGRVLILLFMENDVIINYGARFIRGFALALPFLCVDFLVVGVFQAIGSGMKALIFAILRKVVLEIPALFILNHLFPLYGLAYAQFIAELVLSTVAVFMLVGIFRNAPSK